MSSSTWINTQHYINFSGTSVFNRTSGYVDCLINEPTEIHLNKNNFNRDSGFILNQAWSLITKLLMKVIWGLSTAGTWLHPPTIMSHGQIQRESISRCRQTLEVVSFLMVRTEMGLEMSVDSLFNHLTWLPAQEYFIEFSNHEIFKLYMNSKFLTYLQP
jgi:hypothetical protein